MPTPNTFDRKNLQFALTNAPNIFHQTNIAHLANIIREGAILSPGTLWGLDPNRANQIYNGNVRRLANLKLRAERGYVDYIFCSFVNGLSQGINRYGVVSFEIDKSILMEKEAFIYPFNFVFSWNSARPQDKYSDVTTWNMSVVRYKRMPNIEILGVEYRGVLSPDGKFISIYNVVTDDDVDFMGRFIVEENNLVDIMPMSGRKNVVGTIQAPTNRA